MADKGLKSPAEVDKAAVERFNRLLKADLEREARLTQHFEWRGNKIPPFSIEPMSHERTRLAGQGMTDADRAARKQWLTDQHLAPNEPRNIPELNPRNPIRRALAKPWDAVFNTLRPMIGEKAAGNGRFFVPRFAMAYVVLCASWYQIKYHGMSWEGKHGWHVYSNRDIVLPGDPRYPDAEEKNYTEFGDRGFKQRTAMKD